VLGGEDPVGRGVGEALGQDTGSRYEERGGEPVGFLLGVRAVGDAMLAVQDDAAEFVGSVEPSPTAEEILAKVRRARVALEAVSN
jgi:hypothetical protein